MELSGCRPCSLMPANSYHSPLPQEFASSLFLRRFNLLSLSIWISSNELSSLLLPASGAPRATEQAVCGVSKSGPPPTSASTHRRAVTWAKRLISSVSFLCLRISAPHRGPALGTKRPLRGAGLHPLLVRAFPCCPLEFGWVCLCAQTSAASVALEETCAGYATWHSLPK